MFNDLTNNSPAGGSNPTNSPAPGPSPVPSPGSFSSAAAPRKEVDDIFSETDQIETQGVFSQSRPQIEARTVGLGAATNLDDDLPKPSGSQAFKKIAIALIILVILGAGAYFAYSKFFSQATPVNYTPETAPVTVQPETAAPVVAEPSPTASTTPEITASTSPDINASSTEPVVLVASSTTDLSKIDSDHDGLTDAEEIQLGTNPNLTDTDNDGLTDYEEVKTYKTNPLNPDSDGDGFTDGVEVHGGYNPNGSGKLIK